MTAADLPRVEVPGAQLRQNVAALVAQQRQDGPVRATAGHLAEYRHLLHDADPDSTVPPFVDLTNRPTVPEAAVKTRLMCVDTRLMMTVTVTDVPDLLDPITRRMVAPSRVRIHLSRSDNREWASVEVWGPRRLKAGDLGQTISSMGWHEATREWPVANRPEWLTELLAEYRPDGWACSLFDLPGGAV